MNDHLSTASGPSRRAKVRRRIGVADGTNGHFLPHWTPKPNIYLPGIFAACRFLYRGSTWPSEQMGPTCSSIRICPFLMAHLERHRISAPLHTTGGPGELQISAQLTFSCPIVHGDPIWGAENEMRTETPDSCRFLSLGGRKICLSEDRNVRNSGKKDI